MFGCTSPSCDGSDVIFGGSLRTRNSVADVTESREVLAVHEYSPLMIMMIMRMMRMMMMMRRRMMMRILITDIIDHALDHDDVEPVLGLKVVDMQSLSTPANL